MIRLASLAGATSEGVPPPTKSVDARPTPSGSPGALLALSYSRRQASRYAETRWWRSVQVANAQ